MSTGKSFAYMFCVRFASALLLCTALCSELSGCKSSETIWSIQVTSPDNKITVNARTDQYSGFGTAGVYTSAYLEKAGNSIQVLLLSNETAYPKGITNLDIEWITPSHLNIKYRGYATVEYKAPNCFGVDITIQNL